MFAGIRLLFVVRFYRVGPKEKPWYNLIGACEVEERWELTVEKHWETIERSHDRLEEIILC